MRIDLSKNTVFSVSGAHVGSPKKSLKPSTHTPKSSIASANMTPR